MKKILFLIAILVGMQGLQAQDYTTVTDSDPAAKAVLEKLKTKYGGLNALKADFSLTIEIPEEDRIVQKGKMAQLGDKYRLDMPEQSIISDGKTLWYHLKGNNEVQINDAEEIMEEDEFLSPQKVIDMYENGDFVYILADEYSKGGTVMQHIEFKPIDRESDIFKLKVLVDKKANSIAEVKAFSKDGARYTLKMLSFDPAARFDKGYFKFDKTQFPDIYVEDLRL